MERHHPHRIDAPARRAALSACVAALGLLAPSSVVADNIALQVQKGPGAGQITLTWSGDAPPYGIYRSTSPVSVGSPANLEGTASGSPWIETPPADPQLFYLVATPPAPVCGNGVREAGEQCDDGNLVNLDGCDASCRFEQAQRANWFKMQFATDAVCTQNRLGSAFSSGLLQSQIQTSIDSNISSGSFSLVLSAQNPLTDLSGTNEPSFSLGFLSGAPIAGSGTYNGTNDLDWWYTVGPLTAGRTPVNVLTASIGAHALSAGPGRVALPSVFGPGGPPIVFAAAQLTINTGASSTPLTSGSGLPPGHLAAENLDPALMSYATCGMATAAGSGHLCGRVVAASLAATPLPSGFISSCNLDGFTTANSMLDVLVRGCHSSILGTLMVATQPDQSDPDAPVAGAGPAYTLSAGTNRIVNACRDHTGAAVDLTTCLNSAAYSSFFKLATDRVIPK